MERFLSRVAFATAACITALILVTVAVAFSGGALYLWLVSQAFMPPLAALLVAVAGLGCAAAIALAARLCCGRRPRRAEAARPRGAAAADVAAELGELAAREAVALAQAHPYRAFLVSLAAGFAVGASPELRQVLKDGLER